MKPCADHAALLATAPAFVSGTRLHRETPAGIEASCSACGAALFYPLTDWSDCPTLDDGREKGTVQPAPLRELAPGWERAEVGEGSCTRPVTGIRSRCGRVALYRNRVTLALSCEECADLCGVFPETGDDGGRSP